MSLKYNVIEIFTSEEVRWKGKPLHRAIIDHVRNAKIAARCLVVKGVAGSYENGEIASTSLEILSLNMPLKIEIILPAAELNAILPGIEEMVTDGIVVVEDMDIRSHRTKERLIPRQIQVKDVMTPSPTCVAVSTPVDEIVRLLLNAVFNSVPVLDGENRPIGIVTQDDLITRADMPIRLGLLSYLDRNKTASYLEAFAQKTAGEVMTCPVITVNRNQRLGEAVDSMLTHHLKRMPVVDAEGRLVGILSRLDVFRTITKEAPKWEEMGAANVKVDNMHFVRDVMNRETHTVSLDTPVADLIRTIDADNTRRVVVVDDDHRLLGLISDRDLLGAFAEHRAGLWDFLMAKLPFQEMARKHKELARQTTMKTAADVMKTDVLTVRENTRVEEAIRIMAEKGIKRLPVIDGRGSFKGMVSRDAVLRAGIGQ